MGSFKYLDAIMESKIEGIHTAYLAKIISVSGDTAKIQPLGLYKDSDGKSQKQSVLSKVPICQHVRHYEVSSQSLSSSVGSISPSTHDGHIKITPLKSGDIVVCVCLEKNSSEAKKGNNVLPPKGRHNLSDSIIIGLL